MLLINGWALAEDDISASSVTGASEIEVDGYRGRPTESHPGSLTAGFLALGPGAFFHGLGHFHLGQEERGLALLATEAVGLSLVIVSDVLAADTSRSGRFDVLQSLLAQSGWGLFFGSWFADVIGASRGTRPFDRPDGSKRYGRLELDYRFLSSPLRADQHLIGVSVERRYRYAWLEFDHSQSTDTGSWRSRLAFDLRVSSPTFGLLGLGCETGHSTRFDENWSFIDVIPYVRWRLNLGVVMSSLRNAQVNGRFGYGTAGYIFDQTGLSTAWREKELWMERFIYETSLAFTLSTKLSSEFGLVHDNSQWVGPTSFQPIETFVPRFLMVKGQIKYRYRDINIKFDVLSGNGHQTTLGLEYAL